MRRTLLAPALALALALVSSPAWADGRGQAIFKQHCARCHVVGQGAPVRDQHPSFIDVTLAARQHDGKWLTAFVQKPYAVAPQSECRANLDAEGARHVVHFLADRLRPIAPTARPDGAGAATATGGARPGGVPPAMPMQVVPAPKPPKPQGLVRR